MNTNKTRFESIFKISPYIAMIIIGSVFFIDALSNLPEKIEADVSPTNKKLITVQHYTTNASLAAGKLLIENPSTKMQYLAPETIFDMGYTILILAVSIVLIIFFPDFAYTNPFTKKILWGLRVLFAVLLIFMAANLYRLEWFADQVKDLTAGEYLYDKPTMLDLPEFWILAVLIRLLQVFSKGLSLQKEVQLTI